MSRKMKTQFDRFRIVLVEPQDSGNVGAVCRAAKTMGFSKLVIVGRDRDYFDESRVFTLALHAKDLFNKTVYHSDLQSALQDSVLAVGVTRRRGKFRKYFSFLPEQLAEHLDTLGEGPVDLVFGRESDGLRDDELNLCNAAVRIPSSDSFPSLNLSHAVQIITYSLYRSGNSGITGYRAVPRRRLDQVRDTITGSFEAIGFFKKDEKEEVGRFFSDILSRATLSEGEAARLEKMFRKMAALKIHQPPRSTP
jgi:tRNA/rRNA methyltransferase